MTNISANIAQPVIDLQNVSVGYDGNDVLENIHISLAAGSFTFVTGKSGAGKTTLLSMLYLMKKPSKGVLNVFGKNINFSNRESLAQMRQKIGVVFQDFRLLEHMTVYDNIALPLRVRGMNEKEIHKRVTELLKWIEKSDRSHVVLCAKELLFQFVFLRPLGLRLCFAVTCARDE